MSCEQPHRMDILSTPAWDIFSAWVLTHLLGCSHIISRLDLLCEISRKIMRLIRVCLDILILQTDSVFIDQFPGLPGTDHITREEWLVWESPLSAYQWREIDPRNRVTYTRQASLREGVERRAPIGRSVKGHFSSSYFKMVILRIKTWIYHWWIAIDL